MYYIIFDHTTNCLSFLESDHGFLEGFASYHEAKAEAEIWKKNGDCEAYIIVGECTDERHHII